MKKILSVLFISLSLMVSTFAIEFTLGGRFTAGGNINPDASGYQGGLTGGGIFFNLDLFGGLGFQVEHNFSNQKVTANGSSLTFTDYGLIDTPIYIWYNATLGPIGLGGGLGVNFAYCPKRYSANADDVINVGLAAGANLIFYLTHHFGLVLSGNYVWDFAPTVTKKMDYSSGSVTYYYDSTEISRMSVYGAFGVQYRF